MADQQHTPQEAPPAAPRRVIRVIGRYKLVRLLGEGAMGRVYLATDPELSRDVAIKVLRLDQAGSARDAYIARFRNEARAAARFNHPNVVSVHDAGVDPNLGPYLVYEFIPGLTLRATMDRSQVDTATFVRIARGVAAALDALNIAQIVHRDVKPDNILMAPDGRVKLTDFGIARVPEVTLTRDGQFLGTPAYASPEAIAKGEYSPRGDLFSLAAVLYEVLTGTRPFPGDDAVSVSYAVVNDTPKLASEVRPGLSAAIDEVFVRGLSKQPEDRFTTAKELAEALASAMMPNRVQASTSVARSQGPVRRSAAVSKSRVDSQRSYAPLLVAGFLLAGAAMFVATRYSRTPTPIAALAQPAPSAQQPQLAASPTNATRALVRRLGARRPVNSQTVPHR
jgi:serine/threonine protein kinase